MPPEAENKSKSVPSSTGTSAGGNNNNNNNNGAISNVNEEKLSEEFIQVDDKLYSTAALANIHPGGPLFVKAFAGRDATEAFLSYHRRQFPHSTNLNALVGQKAASKDANSDAEYLELCQIIEKILPRHKSFAPVSYYFKVAFILSTAVGLEIYMHSTGTYVWYLSALLGYVMALIGLNIQHDANHGSVSRIPLVNRLLGLGQDWIGGSSIDWIHQHVVQHHIFCNDVHNDPDLKGGSFMRLTPIEPLLRHQMLQHVYVFVLLSLFGLSIVITSFLNVIEGVRLTPYAKALVPHRILDGVSSLFYYARWFVLPLVLKPSVNTVLNLLPLFMVGGFYLSFFFILSHNFTDVHMYDSKASSTQAKAFQSFLRRQVATSSNVGGPLLCFMNGGLNYQIEHLLFPRIHHAHYPTIAPVVREFCLSKGIPYVHFPTVLDNAIACVKHLQRLGNENTPLEVNRKITSTK